MSTPGGHDHGSVVSRWPILTGTAVGVFTLVPHSFLAPEASLGFAAVLIGFIGGVYFGFAVIRGSPRDQLVEFGVAGLFVTAGIVGLLLWPVVLPLAYVAHGAWDLAHHNRLRLSLVSIPQWYVPWCAAIDVVIGAGLVILWKGNGLL